MTKHDRTEDARYPEEAGLLRELTARNWTLCYFGYRGEPPVLIAGVYQWQLMADVIFLWRDRPAAAYRTPMPAGAGDPFEAEVVIWHHVGDNTAGTVRAALSVLLDDCAATPYGTPDQCVAREIYDYPYVMHSPIAAQPWIRNQ
jgi:hypothetical protein